MAYHDAAKQKVCFGSLNLFLGVQTCTLLQREVPEHELEGRAGIREGGEPILPPSRQVNPQVWVVTG